MTVFAPITHDRVEDMGGGRYSWPHVPNPYLSEDGVDIDETSRDTNRRLNLLRRQREALEQVAETTLNLLAAAFRAEILRIERERDIIYDAEFSRLKAQQTS